MLYLNWTCFQPLAGLDNLTLTSVVFECERSNGTTTDYVYLTLTSVVFEFGKDNEGFAIIKNLTLTSVVFEWIIAQPFNKVIKFNFNKCCI